MGSQYNFSSQETPLNSQEPRSALAIDTGSPLVSVALSLGGEITAERSTEQRGSSGHLLSMIQEVLAKGGLRLSDIEHLVGLRGPGSFTGLRVGLATLLGMRMALGTPTSTMPTLQVLATFVPVGEGSATACVNALRGEWLVQDFSTTPPYLELNQPEVLPTKDLVEKGPAHLVGFGISSLEKESPRGANVRFVEPGPLASQALRVLKDCPADPNTDLLARPLYLRPPAVTPQT